MTEVQPPTSFDTIREMTEISHEKLSPVPEKSAFIFHHNFTQSQK